MPIPSQTITILDPGLGLVEPAATIPLVYGVSSLGTANALVSFSSISDLRAGAGEGPAVEAAARILSKSGGPVRFMRSAASVAAAIGSVSVTRVGSSTGDISTTPPSGTPSDSYEVQVEITVSGTLGAGEFRYSVDDGRTFSPSITIPAGGTFVIPSTGLTITFTPGAGPVFFEDGDLHEFDTTAAFYNATDIGNAVTALLASSITWDFVLFAGKSPDAATSATLAAAIDGHMTTFETNFRYVRAILDGGGDNTSTTITAFAAFSSDRVSVTYGDTDAATDKPFVGWGVPKMPASHAVAARAAAVLISTDLSRFASGALEGVVEISHDEFQTEVMDSNKFTTLRTWPGSPGFYITNGRLFAAAGSDFQFWQFGRLIDVAAATTFVAQQPFIGIGVRTNDPDIPNVGDVGTIDERDAQRLETGVEAALRAQLTEPNNQEGTGGHVSDLGYTIDRSNNVLSSQTIIANVAVRPLGYAKFINTQIGFTTGAV